MPLLRILTPLIKFRACRDARKVTGDAMEVRGGCGYIEEWADPRLLRDAHLGSIWEGTSNIVALDVLRAARREGVAAGARARTSRGLLAATAPPCRRRCRALDRAAALAERGAGRTRPWRAQAASALYHLTSAAAMAWEAARTGDAEPRSRWRGWCCATACCRATRWRRRIRTRRCCRRSLEAA